MANLLPIIVLGGAALLLTGKKKSKPVKKNECAKTFTIKMSDIPHVSIFVDTGDGNELEVKLPKKLVDEINVGNMDIIDIINKFFGDFAPVQCLKDINSTIEIVKEDTSWSGNGPSAFFSAGSGFLEDMLQSGIMSEQQVIAQRDRLVVWWNDNMPGVAQPSA